MLPALRHNCHTLRSAVDGGEYRLRYLIAEKYVLSYNGKRKRLPGGIGHGF